MDYTEQKRIIDGLHQMSIELGCKLKRPYTSDSNGSLLLTAENPKSPHSIECGEFGEKFAEWLSKYPHRTGQIQYGHHTSTVLPESGWLYMPICEAKKMVEDYEASKKQ